MATTQLKNQLPDGRQIRILEMNGQKTFTQTEMFNLLKKGLYDPAIESIMRVKDHDISIQSGAYSSINVESNWRTGEYGFYRRGFKKKYLPLGKEIIYIEDRVSYKLVIPDVSVKVNNGTIGLRPSIGMGIIPIEKLVLEQTDARKFTISVATDFNPETDVKILSMMEPKSWALTDENGYPLSSKPSNYDDQNARHFCVNPVTCFEADSTGYHGSISRRETSGAFGDYDFNLDWRDFNVNTRWSDALVVALVSRNGNRTTN
ncbi:MAG: hypothetical protein WC501_05610 [Candidatus Micrarchaeia archaeon]